jgi:hypothetical protein
MLKEVMRQKSLLKRWHKTMPSSRAFSIASGKWMKRSFGREIIKTPRRSFFS